jgi:integrase
MPGLCRVVFTRGESEGPGNSQKNQINRVSVGIIRESALCRLCRARHKRHTFACRRLLAWYHDGTDIDRAIDQLSVYLGHAKVTDTYWYLEGIPELLALAGQRFEQFAAPTKGGAS